MTHYTERSIGVHTFIPRIVLGCLKDKQQTVSKTTVVKGVEN